MNAISPLDPQLARYASSALELMKLEVLQTLAAHKDPAGFPLVPRQIRVPGSTRPYGTVGLVVDKWLRALPAERRAGLLAGFSREAHLTPDLKAAMQQARLDLRSPRPVLEQVDLGSRFAFVDAALIEKAHASRRFDEAIAGPTGASAAVGAVHPNVALKLRLHKVRCKDETTDAEWKGTDDMLLGGSATDDGNATTAIPQFFVAEFNDGGQKVYSPPKVLKTFSLSGGYPKTFLCLVAIAERDSGGGFGTFLVDLVNAVEDEIEAVVRAAAVAAGAAIGGAVGGPVGALLGAVGALLVAEIVALINRIAADECFTPLMTAVKLGSSGHRFAGGSRTTAERVLAFRQYSGEYEVTYSWEVA